MSDPWYNCKTPARPEVFKLSPYIPGKPVEEVKRELGLERVVKLASNENPLGPSPLAVQRIHELAAQAHIYPDPAGFELKSKLSKLYGVPIDQIVLGNGSDEIIMLLGQAFISPGDEAVMASPTFPIYRTSVILMGGIPVEVPLTPEGKHDVQAMAGRITAKTKLMFVCNPNNPTGTILTLDEVDYLLRQVPENVMVVFDQAYQEYVDDPFYGDALIHLAHGRNLTILHTFSKMYGLAGLRVGFALTTDYAASVLNRVRLSFNQNAFAQAAACAALDDTDFVELSRRTNKEGLKYLREEFCALGLKVYPSWGNFIYVETPFDAQLVFRELLKKGIIIRPATAWKLDKGLRITIGTMEQNRELVRRLTEVLESLST